MSDRDTILGLVEEGKSSREIQEITGFSPSKIRYHREPSRRGNMISRISQHRIRLKKKGLDYSGDKCLKCGYNKCDAALTFHHLDPAEKESRLASGQTKSWDRFKAEADKTILVCHNCHAEHHAGLWDPDQEMIDEQQRIRDSYVDRPLSDY